MNSASDVTKGPQNILLYADDMGCMDFELAVVCGFIYLFFLKWNVSVSLHLGEHTCSLNCEDKCKLCLEDKCKLCLEEKYKQCMETKLHYNLSR